MNELANLKKIDIYEDKFNRGKSKALDDCLIFALENFMKEEVQNTWFLKELKTRHFFKYQKQRKQDSIGAIIAALVERGCSQNVSFKAISSMLDVTPRHVANCFYKIRKEMKLNLEQAKQKGYNEQSLKKMYSVTQDVIACFFVARNQLTVDKISADYPTVRRVFRELSKDNAAFLAIKKLDEATGNVTLPRNSTSS